MVSLRGEGIRKGKELGIETPYALWLQQAGDRSSALRAGFCDISGCLAPRVQTRVWCPAHHRELSGWLYYSEHVMLWLWQPEAVRESAELGEWGSRQQR